MEDCIYKLFNLNQAAAKKVFNYLLKVKGLNCTITEPNKNLAIENTSIYEHGLKGSIFGLEDITEYEENLNSYQKKLLLFNLIQEASQGMDDFDTFIDCYCLTFYDDRFPLQTLIDVNLLGRNMVLKVDDHRNLFPTTNKQLFIKNMLVPAT